MDRRQRGCGAHSAEYSNTDRSNETEATWAMTSSVPTPSSATAHSTKATALRCVCTTPFGSPVEPDV